MNSSGDTPTMQIHNPERYLCDSGPQDGKKYGSGQPFYMQLVRFNHCVYAKKWADYSPTNEEALLIEYGNLQQLSHIHVVTMKDVYKTGNAWHDKVCIILPWYKWVMLFKSVLLIFFFMTAN